MFVGKRTGSVSTMANASHHRADGLASLVVLVGILGAQMGWVFADPLAGLLVVAVIFRAAFNIMVQSFHDLTDGVPDFGAFLCTCFR